MIILSEMPTGMGGKWVLVDYGNNFYAYGVEQDLHTLSGFPVNQCGTKEKVFTRCNSIAELCKKNIEKYKKESKKSKNPHGWEILISHEEKELEMLTNFSHILSEQ